MKTFNISILAIVLLTGCASPVYQLARDGSAPFIGGELIRDRGDGNRLELWTPNRRYEARGFIVERHTNLAALRKRYFSANPKHWERIFAGLDTDHVSYSIEAIAFSSEGDQVSCSLVWGRSAKLAGVCTDQTGTANPVRFEIAQ